jgi:RecJ-like exonuclease
MQDHTTNPNLRKSPRNLLLRMLSAIGSKIFRTDDCRARERGWQVTPRYGGLSRTYRDPRFNSLTPCPACDGRGYNPDLTTCSRCAGSGRLVLDGSNTTQPRRGQQEWGRP